MSPRSQSSAPTLADNVALLPRVCLSPSGVKPLKQAAATGGHRPARRSPAVVARVWGDTSLGTLCGRPPECYGPVAFELCADSPRRTAAADLLGRMTSFQVAAADRGAPC
jgi:hypothetical protein